MFALISFVVGWIGAGHSTVARQGSEIAGWVTVPSTRQLAWEIAYHMRYTPIIGGGIISKKMLQQQVIHH